MKIDYKKWQDGYAKKPREGYEVEVRDHNHALTDMAIYCESGPYSYRETATLMPVRFSVREWRYTKDSQDKILMDILKQGDKFEMGKVFRNLDVNKVRD